MKRTRVAFCFEGINQKNLEVVIGDVSGFKAVELINTAVNRQNVAAVFDHNRSIICTDPAIADLAETFFVSIDDPRQQYNINTTSETTIQKQFQNIAEVCNIDIGDHRSNATKEGPSQNPMDCVFCRYLAGHPDHYQPSMYETENFVLMANTGHFIHGSLLIIPKSHIMSCAELTPAELAELSEVIEDSKFILKEMFGMDVLLWENGSGSGGHGKDKSSIVHAHIHMNPCDMNILKVSAEKGIVPKPLEFEKLSEYQENSYLLIQNYDMKWYIVSDPKLYIPRQYVRQLVAEHIGLPGELWNWRKYMYLDKVRETTDMVREYIISHKSTLPARIIERTRHFT